MKFQKAKKKQKHFKTWISFTVAGLSVDVYACITVAGNINLNRNQEVQSR